MDRKAKLWFALTLAGVLVTVTLILAAPSTSPVSAAGPAAAAAPSGKITLRASNRHPELKYADAADLLGEPQPSGAFSPQSAVAVPIQAMTESDINRDGHPDLVSVHGGEFLVRFGSASGELTLPQSYAFPGTGARAIASGDFNADGFKDFVTANTEAGMVSLMFGNLQGSFDAGPALRLEGNIASVVVGDVNRDGLHDLVAIDRVNNSVRFLPGGADLGATETRDTTLAEVHGLKFANLADFNNDFYLDVVIAGESGVSVLYGDGTGGFSGERVLDQAGAASGLAVADFNGDRFPDVAVSSDEGITVWLTRREKGFSKARRFYAGESPSGLVTGFFNSDGDHDLAVINRSSSQVSVLLNRQGRTFSEPMAMQVEGGPMSLEVGRFGPTAIDSIAIGKEDGRIVLAQAAAVIVLNVSTLADENDCPSCTVADLIALTTPNGTPGGGLGISLREAITAINNDFVLNGTTDQGIGFSGLNPAATPVLLADTPTPASTLTGPPLNCIDRGVSFWRIGPGSPGAVLPPLLAPGTLIDGSNASGVSNTFGPKVIIASFGNGIVITSSAPGTVIKNIAIVGMNGNPAGPPAPANGITVSANNVEILNNNIGLNYDGICVEANTGVGLLLSGASNVHVMHNLIAGNGIQATTIGDEIQINGISLSIPTPQDNLVENNNIGVNKDNTDPLINPGNGVSVQNGATGNTIRNNVIGRNAINGVNVRDNITSNTIIENNRIGVDASGQFPAPNGTTGGDGVALSSFGNSKFNVVTQNLISGNLGNGLSISSDNVQAQGNSITANKIGVNSTGSVQVPNGLAGVLLTGSATGNTIGGPLLGARNQISGNTEHGVRIGGEIGAANPNNNIIQSNDIGPNNQGTGAPFDPTTPADPLPKSNKGGGVLFDGACFANRLANNNIAFNADDTGGAPPVSGITHASTGNFNRFTQNNIFLNPPDGPPDTPTINVIAGNEGLRNTQVNNVFVTSLIKIDSAVTTTANGQTTLSGTVNFLDNGVPGNINNAQIEVFVSKRGEDLPTPPSTTSQMQAEGQLFLNSVISFQPNSQDPDTLDWSADLVIPAPFLLTPTVFVTATVTTGDGSTSPFSIGKVPQFVSPPGGGGGGGGGCSVVVSPASLTFTNAPVGQPTNLVVTVTNNGSVAVTITGASVSGTGFAVDASALPVTLNPSQSLNLTVGFTPTGTAQVTGNLTIQNNCSGTINVPLSGTGTGPRIGVAPTTLDFGSPPAGQSASRVVTIINFGGAPLSITALNINQPTGAGFSLPNPNPFTVAALSNTTLAVNFNPTTPGTKTGTLVITSNDPATPTVNVNLTGIGGDSVPPGVAVQAPGAGQAVGSGQLFEVRFLATDNVGVGTFTIDLSTNGGASFSIALGSGTAVQGIQSFNATAPNIETASAVVRVTVRDLANNVGTGTSGTFTIGQPPVIINGVLPRAKKFKCAVTGSNIQPGAVLRIGSQSWALQLNSFGTRWVVTKPTLSVPGGQRLVQFLTLGVPVSCTVRNPSGLTSAPVTIVPSN